MAALVSRAHRRLRRLPGRARAARPDARARRPAAAARHRDAARDRPGRRPTPLRDIRLRAQRQPPLPPWAPSARDVARAQRLGLPVGGARRPHAEPGAGRPLRLPQRDAGGGAGHPKPLLSQRARGQRRQVPVDPQQAAHVQPGAGTTRRLSRQRVRSQPDDAVGAMRAIPRRCIFL
eukprot:753224-Prymnesium_polylepis.1